MKSFYLVSLIFLLTFTNLHSEEDFGKWKDSLNQKVFTKEFRNVSNFQTTDSSKNMHFISDEQSYSYEIKSGKLLNYCNLKEIPGFTSSKDYYFSNDGKYMYKLTGASLSFFHKDSIYKFQLKVYDLYRKTVIIDSQYNFGLFPIYESNSSYGYSGVNFVSVCPFYCDSTILFSVKYISYGSSKHEKLINLLFDIKSKNLEYKQIYPIFGTTINQSENKKSFYIMEDISELNLWYQYNGRDGKYLIKFYISSENLFYNPDTEKYTFRMHSGRTGSSSSHFTSAFLPFGFTGDSKYVIAANSSINYPHLKFYSTTSIQDTFFFRLDTLKYASYKVLSTGTYNSKSIYFSKYEKNFTKIIESDYKTMNDLNYYILDFEIQEFKNIDSNIFLVTSVKDSNTKFHIIDLEKYNYKNRLNLEVSEYYPTTLDSVRFNIKDIISLYNIQIDYGDGTIDTLINSKHNYKYPGKYTVKLSADSYDGSHIYKEFKEIVNVRKGVELDLVIEQKNHGNYIEFNFSRKNKLIENNLIEIEITLPPDDINYNKTLRKFQMTNFHQETLPNNLQFMYLTVKSKDKINNKIYQRKDTLVLKGEMPNYLQKEDLVYIKLNDRSSYIQLDSSGKGKLVNYQFVENNQNVYSSFVYIIKNNKANLIYDYFYGGGNAYFKRINNKYHYFRNITYVEDHEEGIQIKLYHSYYYRNDSNILVAGPIDRATFIESKDNNDSILFYSSSNVLYKSDNELNFTPIETFDFYTVGGVSSQNGKNIKIFRTYQGNTDYNSFLHYEKEDNKKIVLVHEYKNIIYNKEMRYDLSCRIYKDKKVYFFTEPIIGDNISIKNIALIDLESKEVKDVTQSDMIVYDIIPIDENYSAFLGTKDKMAIIRIVSNNSGLIVKDFYDSNRYGIYKSGILNPDKSLSLWGWNGTNYLYTTTTTPLVEYLSEIKEEKISNNFELYPNPTSNELNIYNQNTKIDKIKLYSIPYKEYPVEIIESNNQLTKINTNFLPIGTYFLIINEKETLKFNIIK